MTKCRMWRGRRSERLVAAAFLVVVLITVCLVVADNRDNSDAAAGDMFTGHVAIGDCTYEMPFKVLTESDSTGTVQVGTGAQYKCSLSDNCASGCLTVPDTVVHNGITYSVTSISDYAFFRCHSLTSVTIPDSVTSVSDYAFYECFLLTSVTIPDSVTSIGNGAFEYCYTLKTVTILGSVESIGNGAFSGCCSLASITLPDGMRSIGNGAFSGCCSLASITLPDSMRSIGDSAFSSSYSLTSVTIPDNVESIGDGAFSSCNSLASVTIPDSVTKIGTKAFQYCCSLATVVIGGKDAWITTITNSGKIGADVFAGGYISSGQKILFQFADGVTKQDMLLGPKGFNCSLYAVTTGGIQYYSGSGVSGNITWSLADNVLTLSGKGAMTDYRSIQDIPWLANNCNKGQNITSVVIKPGVTSVAGYAFISCLSLKSVTIPDSVESIGDSAFKYCYSLISVKIPDKVESIGDSTFYYCQSLTAVTIPSSVTIVGASAFVGCYSLTSVTIPDSVESIGDSAFNGCSSLTSVTIPDSVESIGDSAFNGCTFYDTAGKVIYSQTAAAFAGHTFVGPTSQQLYAGPTFVLTGDDGIAKLETSPDGTAYTEYTKPVTVPSGSSLYVRATAATGYTVVSDDHDLGSPCVIRFENVTAYTAYIASSEPAYIVTLGTHMTGAVGGTAIVSGTTAVTVEDTIALTFDTGYGIDTVTNAVLQSGNMYKADGTGDVAFTAQVNFYPVAFAQPAAGQGTVTAKIGANAVASGDPIAYGTTVVFTYAPAGGYYAVGWNNASSSAPYATATLKVGTYNPAVSVTVDDTYTVALVSSPVASAAFEYKIGDGAVQTYTEAFSIGYGETLTVTVTAADGYTFTDWDDGSTDAVRNIASVTGPLTLTAVSAADSPAPAGTDWSMAIVAAAIVVLIAAVAAVLFFAGRKDGR